MNYLHPKVWNIEHMIFISRIRYWFAEDELQMQTIENSQHIWDRSKFAKNKQQTKLFELG